LFCGVAVKEPGITDLAAETEDVSGSEGDVENALNFCFEEWDIAAEEARTVLQAYGLPVASCGQEWVVNGVIDESGADAAGGVSALRVIYRVVGIVFGVADFDKLVAVLEIGGEETAEPV
jgi:hypothetical protein